MEKSEIVERDGKLFVLDPWENHWTKPIKYRLAWPTGLFSKDYSHFIGKKCVHWSGGICRLDNGIFLKLEHGEKTHPDDEYTEERRIPRPHMKHEYRNGKWSV